LDGPVPRPVRSERSGRGAAKPYPFLLCGDGSAVPRGANPSEPKLETLRPEGPDTTEGNDAGRLDRALAVDVDPEHVTAYVIGVGQRKVR
jgi:hypothetical protein